MKRLAILAACLAAAPTLADSLRANLSGFQEVPVVTTVAEGTFDGRISHDETTISYTLTFSGLQGTVRQSHIHVAQKSVNGMIVLWLCGSTVNPGPAGTQTCPQSGTITGTLTAANLQTGGTQQIGDFADVIDAIRNGAAYANVHTDLSPGGEIRGQISGH